MSKYYLDFEQPLIDLENKLTSLKNTSLKTGIDVTNQIITLQEELEKTKVNIYQNLSRWEKVQLARHPLRPNTLDYIKLLTNYWFEIHGDRSYGDDKAIITGLAKIENKEVVILGHQKGRGTKDKLFRNFGMARPEGYRKSYRLMKLAEKFNLPIISFLDTPGAYPGIGAEERGQAQAIAKNIYLMSVLKVPIICIVIGEGASGGALGIGVGDKLVCLENTWFSVISPEGCASILFRDAKRAEEAANAMKVSSQDLLEMGIADKIINEPLGGAHHDPNQIALDIKKIIFECLDELEPINKKDLIKNRINKFDKMGKWKLIDNE